MSPLAGVFVAAVTPRRDGPEIDMAATFELLDFLSRQGVAGVALMGSTGEFLHFTLEERCRLTSLAIKRSRVPVIAGIGHSTLEGAVSLGREAAYSGAAALLLMPPFFFRYSQEQIAEFYLRFAREIEGAAPILLYNIPAFTSPIAGETAVQLLATGQFAGIKDSSGSWENFVRLRAARRQRSFTLLVGNDVLYAAARQAGADGVVSGCGCAVPELLLALDRALLSAQPRKAELLEARLQEFISWIEAFPAPVGVREAVRLRGISTGPLAVPLPALAQRRLEEFREWFKAWLPDVRKECADA